MKFQFFKYFCEKGIEELLEGLPSKEVSNAVLVYFLFSVNLQVDDDWINVSL
jgi:hypothetical protein